jgi:hypothetical protein
MRTGFKNGGCEVLTAVSIWELCPSDECGNVNAESLGYMRITRQLINLYLHQQPWWNMLQCGQN